MNVVPIEKLQTDLYIGIEKKDALILRSVSIAANIGAYKCSINKEELARYLVIENRAERELKRLGNLAVAN